MRIAGLAGVIGLGSSLIPFAAASLEQGLAALQGAWLSGGVDCGEVYAFTGKGAAAFKKSVDLFAPAFIVSGTRLRTPQASCRIKSVQLDGNRQLLILDCANAVSGNEVRVLMASHPDGSLRRYLNAEDTIGTPYARCSP